MLSALLYYVQNANKVIIIKYLRFVLGCCFTCATNLSMINHYSYFKMNYLWFLISFLKGGFSSFFINFSLSYWVSLLRSHFLSLGWDNPPCRGLQSAGRPGKSLNYPFGSKLKPHHNPPRSVRLRTPAFLRLIVGLNFFFLLCCENGKITLKSK